MYYINIIYICIDFVTQSMNEHSVKYRKDIRLQDDEHVKGEWN